jgi:hypothetical protein
VVEVSDAAFLAGCIEFREGDIGFIDAHNVIGIEVPMFYDGV